jgi:transposase InsO family protein
MTGRSVRSLLDQAGLPRATYYRWRARQADDRLADRVVLPDRHIVLPTADEVTAVCRYAQNYPVVGYKRLTWQMVDDDVAYLRPHQVYQILHQHDLMSRGTIPPPEALRRPAEPDHPDQVWHIDLMYLYIGPRWYYLVDILDGYSRFLVGWSLNMTMEADTVTMTAQAALDQLGQRLPSEPRFVHDHGSQFISAEWRALVEAAGVLDIKTRVAHPESNGRLERLHRTHRREGLADDDLTDYAQARVVMSRWGVYYNHKRPHSALQYLCPVDYYRGNPAARLAERERKLAQALAMRRAYWEAHSGDKGQCQPSHN